MTPDAKGKLGMMNGQRSYRLRCLDMVTILAFLLPVNDRAWSDGLQRKLTRELPHAVDLRPDFEKLGLMPRRQGKRNTCSVFTTTAAIEFAVSKQSGKGTPLSVEYLNWACNQVIGNQSADRGQFFHHLLAGFAKYGLCTDEQMPYQRRFDPSLIPTTETTASAKEILDQNLTIHWINPWEKEPGLSEEQLLEIKRVLARGWPVAAGSSHSRLLVGYVDDAQKPGGGTFYTKDSGSGKFASVDYEFVRTKVSDVFWVEAPL